MFPVTHGKGSPRKLHRGERFQLRPRLEGLAARSLLAPASLVNFDAIAPGYLANRVTGGEAEGG